MSIGISDRQLFGELGVRAEMPGVGGVNPFFWRPFAIGVMSIATDTTTSNYEKQNRGRDRASSDYRWTHRSASLLIETISMNSSDKLRNPSKAASILVVGSNRT
jgi:hypothetical protein